MKYGFVLTVSFAIGVLIGSSVGPPRLALAITVVACGLWCAAGGHVYDRLFDHPDFPSGDPIDE